MFQVGLDTGILDEEVGESGTKVYNNSGSLWLRGLKFNSQRLSAIKGSV